MHILYLHQEVRTNVNEWMRLSPIPFHRWKYPVAGPGMEKTLKDACSLWSRPVVWERNSNTQPRSLCCGPRRRTRAPGVGGELLWEDWWGRVNAEGRLKLALMLNLASWHSDQIQCSTHFLWGLAWWLRGKESACNARDLGSIPELGRSPGEGKSYPLQYSCLENPMERSLAGNSSWGLQRVTISPSFFPNSKCAFRLLSYNHCCSLRLKYREDCPVFAQSAKRISSIQEFFHPEQEVQI